MCTMYNVYFRETDAAVAQASSQQDLAYNDTVSLNSNKVPVRFYFMQTVTFCTHRG
jgi:hypothetical protein